MKQQATAPGFFEQYARALECCEIDDMMEFYHLPCLIITDQQVTTVSEAQGLERIFGDCSAYYKKHGLVTVIPTVTEDQAASDTTRLVKVHYEFRDSENKVIYTCDYWYTLKRDEQGKLKILTSLDINESKQKEEIARKMQLHVG